MVFNYIMWVIKAMVFNYIIWVIKAMVYTYILVELLTASDESDKNI